MSISVALAYADDPDSRLMFCGYQYVPDDVNTGAAAVGIGPVRWIRMTLKRGVWCGDLTQFRPVAFSTVEAAQAALDEIAKSHPTLAARLLLVNSTTGTEIASADA